MRISRSGSSTRRWCEGSYGRGDAVGPFCRVANRTWPDQRFMLVGPCFVPRFVPTRGALPSRRGQLSRVCKASDLMSNVTRGRLAEYIVYRAVGSAATAVRDEWDAFDLLQALKSVLAAPRDGGRVFVFFDLDEYLAQIQGERHAKVTGCSGKLSTRSRARGRRSFSSVHRCSSMARSPTRSQSSTGHYPPSVRPAICSGRTTGH